MFQDNTETRVVHSAGRLHGRRPLLSGMVTLLLLMGFCSSGLASGPWWNSGWGYRVRIDVDPEGYARYQKPVERAINFTSLFSAVGASGALNENALRVIEADGSGNVIDSTVVFQFDKDPDYNATSKASGVLILAMKGTTGSSTARHFDVYFDNRPGFTAPSFTGEVSISSLSDWEGQESFRIVTTRATYYYHKLGGGFASMIDVNGHDWISYHPPPSGFNGEWRGIPNMGNCAHPGYTNSTSAIASQGPLKVTILSQTNDGVQKWYTSVYPHFVTVYVAKSDSNYWFLYEGTPAGALNGSSQFMFKSTGEKIFLDTDWSADITGDEWAYFSDPGINRSLYMIHHEQDNLPESYWNGGGDGMTVFGFGRQRDTTEWFLTAVPQTLSFGIMDGTSFSASTDTIQAVFRPITVSLGTPEKVLPSVPAAPALVAPTNAATGIVVPALLRWSPAASATSYRLQVSTEASFTTGVVYDDSTLTDTTKSLSGLESKTTYFWRVRGKNVAGPGGFSSAWQFQTGLTTPVLLAPSNGATGQAVPVLLRWKRVNGATGYTVQVSTSPSFSGGIVIDDPAVTDTVRSAGGLSSTTQYYWRVKARDSGGEGAFSTGWNFTTAVASPPLASPANHAVDIPLSLTLVWRSSPLALSYHVQVSSDAGFAGGMVVDDATVTDTTRPVSGLQKSTKYYWRVSAVAAGGEGPFSTGWDFTTYLPPPVLLSPANESIGQPLNVTFLWNKGEGAVHYWFQLATDSNFVALIKNDSTVADTTRSVIGLLNSTTYYWRVSTETALAASPFSSRWKFRVLAPIPEAVVLNTPINGGLVVSDSVQLIWRRTTTPSARYWVELGLDAGFVLHMMDTTVTDTSKVFHGLTSGNSYWWKVRGGNNEAWGPMSEVRQFNLITGVEGAPELPREYALGQNYPNPFNPSTVIPFALPAGGEVRVDIYNMLGALVATPVDGSFDAGQHAVRFDASGISSGTYFYRMTVNGSIFIRRMLLLK